MPAEGSPSRPEAAEGPSRTASAPGPAPARRAGLRGWIPRRRCVGCRTVQPRPELFRLALGAEGTVCLDILGRLPGRGAYLCRTTGLRCMEVARRRGALVRSLRVSDHPVDHERLCAELRAATDEEQS
ncbi:MAG: YlxR family protein [Candidatus Dormibacteria bacterium]